MRSADNALAIETNRRLREASEKVRKSADALVQIDRERRTHTLSHSMWSRRLESAGFASTDVALAVADWLDGTADLVARTSLYARGVDCQSALAVADAILGDDS